MRENEKTAETISVEVFFGPLFKILLRDWQIAGYVAASALWLF